ncbi:hypothetical protein J6590_012981 [Homalodisca vitripennis]|nr:hypothetical protein J6590_012981 [Homalodisca vitripennis]
MSAPGYVVGSAGEDLRTSRGVQELRQGIGADESPIHCAPLKASFPVNGRTIYTLVTSVAMSRAETSRDLHPLSLLLTVCVQRHHHPSPTSPPSVNCGNRHAAISCAHRVSYGRKVRWRVRHSRRAKNKIMHGEFEMDLASATAVYRRERTKKLVRRAATQLRPDGQTSHRVYVRCDVISNADAASDLLATPHLIYIHSEHSPPSHPHGTEYRNTL